MLLADFPSAPEPLLRPVRADDAPAMQRFLQGLSPRRGSCASTVA